MSSIRCNHALVRIDLITSLGTSRFRKTHLLRRVRAVLRLKFRGWDFCIPILPTLSEATAPMDKLQHLGKQVFKNMPLKQRYGFLEQVRRNGISRRGIWEGCGEEFGMLKPV